MVDRPTPSPPDEAVREHLARILASPAFLRSETLSSFLSLVVDETLAGRTDNLEEHTVAVSALGRGEDFEPRIDTIVRVQSGRLRRTLSHYYDTDGQADELRFELPRGTCRPTIRDSTSAPTPSQAALSSVTPSGPTIAVMPLASRGSLPIDGDFVAGLGEELVSDLTRFDGLTVLSYYASSHHDNDAEDPRETGLALGADYLVTGSVRMHPDEVSVRADLSHAESGTLLWSRRFDRRLTVGSLVEIQDEIVGQVAAALADDYGAMPRDRSRVSMGKPPTELGAYESVLLGNRYVSELSPEIYAKALPALERAVRLQPDYAMAWGLLTHLYFDAHALDMVRVGQPMRRAEQAARKAVSLDPACSRAHLAMATIDFYHRDREAVLADCERVVEINPNAAWMVANAGWWMVLVGEPERGLELLYQGLDLNPYNPGHMHAAPCLHRYCRREYDEALEQAKRIATPALFWDPLLRAACLGQLGRIDEASAALQRCLELRPQLPRQYRRDIGCYAFEHAWVEHLVEGLVLSGFEPET